MSLYELAAEIRAIQDELEDEQYEGDEWLWNKLSACELDSTIKGAQIARWIKNLEAEEESLSKEIVTLQLRKKARANKAQSLRKFYAGFMKLAGLKRVDAGIATITLRPASKRLEVEAAKCWDWPPQVFDAAVASGAVVEKLEVNKTKLKELPDYLALPGVTEVEGEETIQIR